MNYLKDATSSLDDARSSLLALDDEPDDCLPFFDSSLLPGLDDLWSFAKSDRLEEFCFLKDDTNFSFCSVFDRGDLDSVLFLDFETDCEKSFVDVANPGRRKSMEESCDWLEGFDWLWFAADAEAGRFNGFPSWVEAGFPNESWRAERLK